MMRRTRALALSLSMLCGLSTTRDARACGGELEGPVAANTGNPDLPLTRFAAGHVGVIPVGGRWGRGFLAAAWRMFTATPLDDVERAALVTFARARYDHVPAATIAPVEGTATAARPEAASTVWFEARREALGDAPPATFTNGWESNYQWTDNCLDDAFVTAAATLRARAETLRGDPATLRAWVDAQDAVFSNCGAQGGRTPDEAPASAPLAVRRDRAYQIAAAHFYAGRFDEAERRFRAIADDVSSPWADTARYLVVRTITRAAQRGHEVVDRAGLDRAADEAQSLITGPAGVARDRASRYLGWIDSLRGGDARAHQLGVALTRPGQGRDYADNLVDYALLMQRSQSPFARQPNDPDRLTAWIGVLEGAVPREVAVGYARETRAPVWIAAALAAQGEPRDASLDPVLALARDRVRPGEPAYATVQFHRLRVLAARGAAPYAEVTRVMGLVGDAEGPSARAMFRALAAQTAPDLARFVTHAHATPAGWDDAEGLIVPPAAADAVDALTPDAAAALSVRVPVTTLAHAAAMTTLPAPVRVALAEAAAVRAALLDDDTTLAALAAQRRLWPAEVARRVGPVLDATTRDARHLAAVRAALDGASVMVASPMIDYTPRDGEFWPSRCETPLPTAEPAAFLTAAERVQWRAERARWAAMGDGPTLLAREAARLAAVFPRDPSMPRVLADAVRGTRNNGCGPRAPVHAASRAAFVALHRRFATSPEARATAYWY